MRYRSTGGLDKVRQEATVVEGVAEYYAAVGNGRKVALISAEFPTFNSKSRKSGADRSRIFSKKAQEL